MSQPNPGQKAAAQLLKVLIVDDEPFIVAALKRELGEVPCKLVTFEHSQEALQAALSQEYALIISDNMMPELSGLEMLTRIKRKFPLTRRILLTGHTDLSEAVGAFNTDTIHRFMNKPWNKSELLAAVVEEIETYKQGKKNSITRERLEQAAQETTLLLEEKENNLKEVRTQVFLYQDSMGANAVQVLPALRRLSFLVVDENAEVRSLMVKTLKHLGIERSWSVPDPLKALAFLQNQVAVDVILSEYNMSSANGLRLFKSIRQMQGPPAEAIFMLVTAQENREAVLNAIEQGVDGYIIKPFRLKNLLDKIESVAEKRAKLSLEHKLVNLKPLTFVIANKETEHRLAIEQVLHDCGVRNTIITGSGESVLKQVNKEKVDIVIYDCNVIDPYWPHLWESLLQMENGQVPALIVTSVNPAEGEAKRAAEAGLTAYLPGPLQRNKLLQTIVWAFDDYRRVVGTDSPIAAAK